MIKAALSATVIGFVAPVLSDVRCFPVEGLDGGCIQRAVDAAAAAGGGRVVVGAGVYPSGPLFIKSHVDLHLEKDARIVFTTNSAEFASVPPTVARKMGSGFLLAWDSEDIAITGEGTFDGQGGMYFAHRPWRGNDARFFDPVLPRSQMVTFVRCRNVRMNGVTFRDSASWTMRLRLCENVELDRIRVINDLRFINADGIDIDGCRDFRLRRSKFLTGDDSVVLRAIPEPNSNEKIVTEDVLVDDCDLTSACQCVRLGCPSDDTIRRVVLRNLRLAGHNGICMENPPWYLSDSNEGNVNFHDLLIENVSGTLEAHAIRLNTFSGVKIRGLRDVLFRNLDVADRQGLLLRTNAFSPYERLRFENVRYNGKVLTDGMPDVAGTGNRNPLVRTKPGEFNYRPPVDYRKPLYLDVVNDDGLCLEKALDQVAAHGKGVVRVAAGTYKTAELTLGSGVELRLDAGVVVECKGLVSKGSHDVAITGAGTVNICCGGVSFVDCSSVRLDGFHLSGAGDGLLRLLRCSDVEIDSICGEYSLEDCCEVRVGPTFASRMPESGICAHQGDCGRYAGNTVRGIASAVKLGAEMIEFDVQRCKTGEFVLMHDREIDRLTTGRGRIADHTLLELKEYRVRFKGGESDEIATLDEALAAIPVTGVWINLHCYAGRTNIADLARYIRSRGRLHQTCFCAQLADIELARSAVPELIANNVERPGPRNRDWTDSECQKFVDDSVAHRCSFLQLSRPWARCFSDACHKAGIKVVYFRSDNPEELPDLRARGIDFIMTNRLAEMKSRK